ncbi:MAG: hypothetical protein OER95_02290 [Acidimicrobiia bacterium]|nr:hypothetical protein [Acidimicrobiia bacterium]
MVIYRGSDGKPGYHQTDDIHDAVGFVEQMRNDQGVEHARIFRLEEVVFQYKPYYRVELADLGVAPPEADRVDAETAPPEGGDHAVLTSGTGNGASGLINGSNGASEGPVVTADPLGDEDSSGAKRGLFGR